MHISSLVREYAVIQICRDYRTDWPGARLRIGDFAEAWKSTGLREADLALALREMLDAGVFSGQPLDLDSELEVSSVGAEMMGRALGGLDGLVERLLVQRTLERARRRLRSGRPVSGIQPPPRRRSADQGRASS